MRRILVVGTDAWTDRRTTNDVLKEVMRVYKGPYTLVTEDAEGGASRHAAVAATQLGWKIDAYKVDDACEAGCPAGHRRRSAAGWDYCPTARRRTITAHLDATGDDRIDLFLVLKRPIARDTGDRLGQADAKRRGIAVWERTQIPAAPARARGPRNTREEKAA